MDELGASFEADIFSARDLIDLDDRVAVMGSEHLCPVRPISLIAVVFLWVVRGGDHYAALAAKFTNSKGYLGRRTKALEEIDLDAVSREDLSGDTCEDVTIITAVVADSYRDLGEGSESLLEVVRQALSSSPDGVAVHTVGAYAHDPAQTTRTEF